MIRNDGGRLRRRVLYPLSYGRVREWEPLVYRRLLPVAYGLVAISREFALRVLGNRIATRSIEPPHFLL